MSPNVERVKQSIQQLPTVELKELFDWFEDYKPNLEQKPSDEKLEVRVLRRLLEKGLISEIVEPMTDEEDDEFEPIMIAGEPLSQMIIRERR